MTADVIEVVGSPVSAPPFDGTRPNVGTSECGPGWNKHLPFSPSLREDRS